MAQNTRLTTEQLPIFVPMVAIYSYILIYIHIYSYIFIYINIYSYIRKKWINGYGWHKMQDCPWGRRAVPEGEGNTDELGHDSIF